MILVAAILTCQQALAVANNVMNSPYLNDEQRYGLIQELDEASGFSCNFSLDEDRQNFNSINNNIKN